MRRSQSQRFQFVYFFQGQVNANEGVFVTQIGVNNYYLQFEVKVQPFNNLGAGPNSTISTIYSAEDCKYITF